MKWGQTPWDNMSRDELLREVQRMYSAIVSLNSALGLCAHGERGGYWGTNGTGGSALEKARQILEPLHERVDSESIYRAFYRYADDLLFESNGYDIGSGWVVCPVCKTMYGDGPNVKQVAETPCKDKGLYPNCEGILHTLTWADLRPSEEQP